jgi:hypothetical protein
MTHNRFHDVFVYIPVIARYFVCRIAVLIHTNGFVDTRALTTDPLR